MTPESIALAHSLGLHALTRNAMATRLRNMLAACPTVEFSGLESGGIYAYKTYNGYQQIAVGRITPPAHRRRHQLTVAWRPESEQVASATSSLNYRRT